jgi:GTP-binding protein
MRLEFKIPARGLIGFRSELLTSTKGNGIMNHIFHGYEPYKGEIPGRNRGVIVAWENGLTTSYGLNNAEERGVLFVEPGIQVYEGMIVGEHSREMDLDFNVCKKKHITNMRKSGSEEAIRLMEPRLLTLEQALEYINEDELVEVTPKTVRLRKAELNRNSRGKK